ncbi:MAG: substrate-binding domain-containing protein [Planctomycetia bacterium]|nr:substrate-binding domain-containing protein [Planctomycetia bacterium]
MNTAIGRTLILTIFAAAACCTGCNDGGGASTPPTATAPKDAAAKDAPKDAASKEVASADTPAKDAAGKDAAAKPAGPVRRVIVMNNGPDPFWVAMRSGMLKAEKDFNLPAAGLSAVMDEGDGTPKAQLDKLKNYANATDVAAVAISATDAKNPALADAMRALRKQGIPVITIDSDVDRKTSRDARFAYLGTDNVVGGRQMGMAAKGLHPAGGKYVSFVGLKGASNAAERHSGFAQGAGDKFVELEYLGDEMNRSVAQKNVLDAINRNKDVDAFVGIWAYNAHAIVQVLEKQPDVRKRSIVVVFDAAPLALRHMAEGQIDAMIVQNPYDMGYKGVQLMKALVTDDHKAIHELFPDYDPQQKKFTKDDADVFTTELRVVVPDKDSPLSKANFDPQTVFFKFSDFQKWLNERGLKGS